MRELAEWAEPVIGEPLFTLSTDEKRLIGVDDDNDLSVGTTVEGGAILSCEGVVQVRQEVVGSPPAHYAFRNVRTAPELAANALVRFN